MNRIIIEDIKLNNKKKFDLPKKTEFSSHILDIKKKEIKKVPISRVERIGRTPRVRSKPRVIHKSTMIIFIICVLGGGVYFGGNMLQKADVNIIAKHQTINYKDKQFTATKDQSAGGINFEIMIVSDKKNKNIILTDTKEVSLKAKGVVTLYNEFGLTPQKLLAGSFISDKDGKAYKIDNTVTIPGYKIGSDKKIIPGEIDVSVTSFLPGSAYNGNQSDFYISSFKNTPKYNKIYGKLKSELSGGAQGLVYVLNEDNKKTLDDIINSSLKNDLFSQVKAQVPPGYLLYPDAFNFSYKIDDNVFSETPDGKVQVEGTLSVVIIKEQSLIDSIMKTSLPNVKGDELKEVTLPDINNLTFSFTDENQVIAKELEQISFLLNGEMDAIWNPDIDKIKTNLVGVNKDNVASIFKQDPGISSASVKIFPLWQKNIPKDISRINIFTKLSN